MEKSPSSSRTADQFLVRFPDGVRDQLAEEAKRNGRSMNAEIVVRLQRSLEGKPNIQWAAGSAPAEMISRNRPLVDADQINELAKLVAKHLKDAK